MLTYTRQTAIAGHGRVLSNFWGSGSIGPDPVRFIIVTIMLIVLHTVYRFTKLGRNLYASGGNPVKAAYLAWTQCRRAAGLSPTLSAASWPLWPEFCSHLCSTPRRPISGLTPLLAIAASIMGGASLLGGKGTAMGTLFGVLSLGILANGMPNLVGVHTYFQIGIKALILILVVGLDAVLTQNQRKRLMRTMVRGTE